MSFTLFPLLDLMIDFYRKPKDFNRFQDYLGILTGDSKNDMQVPIPYFNPMGKDHVLKKLIELKKIGAEDIVRETLKQINLEIKHEGEIKVALGLADDLMGGWTNRYTTDFDSKFRINAYIKRNFCIPVFWTSEEFNSSLVKSRVREYCLRTHYWKLFKKPKTLEDHINQEKFVLKKSPLGAVYQNLNDSQFNKKYLEPNKESTDYNLIFNFFYGDDVCSELGYPQFGIKDQMAAFKIPK